MRRRSGALLRLAGRTVMDPYKTTIERAFELARPRAFTTIAELVARLDGEGYDGRQIHGRTLRKELGDLIKEANVLRTRDAIRAIIPELEKRPLIAFPGGGGTKPRL